MALSAAEKALEAAQEEVSKHHEEFVASHGDERLNFVLMHKTLVDRLKDIKDAAKTDMVIAINQASERDAMHKYEKAALRLLHDSDKMTEEQKKIFEGYDMAFKESDEEAVPGQGRFILEYSETIKEIVAEIKRLDDFVMVREKCVHIVKIDEMRSAAAKIEAEVFMNEELKKHFEAAQVNATNLQALTRCQEQLSVFSDKYKAEFAKVETLQAEKKAAEENAEAFKIERDEAKQELQAMRDFKALAERVSRPQADRRAGRDDQKDAEQWQRVDRARGRPGRHAHHDHDAQAAHGDRKRNVDAANSHFGLRNANGEKYCQYQFTNPEGCIKGDSCRFKATHGGPDPHPDHESRIAKKRQRSQNDDHPRNDDKKNREDRKKDDDAQGLQ